MCKDYEVAHNVAWQTTLTLEKEKDLKAIDALPNHY
jgi:hypothetical protein